MIIVTTADYCKNTLLVIVKYFIIFVSLFFGGFFLSFLPTRIALYCDEDKTGLVPCPISHTEEP